jgi:hypothetical protein
MMAPASLGKSPKPHSFLETELGTMLLAAG